MPDTGRSADTQKQLSGLEFVQGLVSGTLPLNTMAETLGYDITEAVKGRVVIAKPNGIHLNPSGTVHGGLAATLLDTCMGLAIRSMLDKGIGLGPLKDGSPINRGGFSHTVRRHV